ncbi:TrmH family RNA methyltransferase [Nesterenkonia flava]|uniref:RNA methyltransferase n=1 Tax=Nesterenkonia flava TaxID=469799 RepID=A0ABU1FQY8_9MICC|nr:RNA methyltransferase [Nesterenkonia flava]MDR5711060.1 RNA methyltransferase [Nesterenkonia flava]
MTDEFLIENPRSDRVKKVAALATRAGRKKQKLFQAEGPQPVREALALWLRRWDEPDTFATTADPRDSGRRRAQLAPVWCLPEVDALYFDPEALQQHPDIEALLDRVREVLFDPERQLPREARIFLREATSEVLKAMGDAETSQGMIAVCRIPELEFEGLDSLLVGMSASTVQVTSEGSTQGASVNYPPVQLAPVLAGVQDPGNVGTLIRTADAAGAGVVILTPGSSDPWAPKVVRAAAGSHFHVPIASGIDLQQLTDFVRSNGGQVLAADGYGDVSLAQLQAEGGAGLVPPTYWLLGNEAHGLSDQEKALADQRVSIPLYGQAESLNVAVAGALCLYASATAQHAGEGA